MRTKRIQEVLREARKTLTMDNADFSLIVPLNDLPKTEADVTDFIRERTRLWRQSWIEAPINEALELLSK